ncbi:hypothetical protein OH491_26880 [Termitidicoccus mucosus]
MSYFPNTKTSVLYLLCIYLVHIAPPVASRVHADAHSDTFQEAALLRYRLSSDSIDFTLLESFDGLPKVVMLHLKSSQEEAKPLRLSFASTDMRIPFSPIIPPYVGLHAKRISLKVWVEDPGCLAGATIVAGREDGTQEKFSFDPSPVQAYKWTTFSWPLAMSGEPASRLNCVELVLESRPRTDAFAYLADLNIQYHGQQEPYDLLTTDIPLLTTGMSTPLETNPVRSLPVRDTLALGGFDIHDPNAAKQIPILATLVKNEFPNWDFILAPVWTPPLSIHKELKKLPEGVYFQFQKARMDPGYLHAVDAMPCNGRGEVLDNFSNAVMGTHPVIQEGLRDQIDYAASLGINNFKQVDMIWPYRNGRWGYDDASVAAYRKALDGKDEGLDILPGLPGKLNRGGMIHFWDYYEYYHGFRLQPADLELKNWDEYSPVSEQTAANGGDREHLNLGLYIQLYHYQWLLQAQRFGRWAKAHNGTHGYTLNPEDLGNGGDYVFLVRLADAGLPYIEYFGGPAVLRGAYHNLPMYIHSAETAGRKFGLIMEIGQTGHGQPYLAPEINYLYAFELAAGGLRSYHNEWVADMWKAITAFPPASPQKDFLFDRWSAWMTGALGFVFAREENIRRPNTRVFNISTRPPGYYVSSWIWGLSQGPSFGPMLAQAHVPFMQWDRAGMSEILAEADIIFYAPPYGRQEDAQRLRQWLQNPGKSLMLHSNVPFSIDDGRARLLPGVENVNYTSAEQHYTDYLSERNDFDHALFPELKSVRPLENGAWSALPNAEILLGDRDRPLLSRLHLPSGSSIYYLHTSPRRMDAGQSAAVVDILARRLHLPRTITASSSPVMAHRFSAPGFEVLDIWTGLDILGFKAGYGPHLMPGREAEDFEPAQRPYPLLLPGVDVTIEVPVGEAGDYRVYAFFSGNECVVPSSPDKMLSLKISNISAEQFFFTVDTPGVREKIKMLKKQRARLFPYSPDLPRN